MRKTILVGFILTIVSLLFAGTMFIHLNDGTTVDIEISEINFITFTDSLLFFEDFSGDLSAWNFWWQGSYTAEIIFDDGNPPPCLLLDDYLNYGTYGVSNQTFSYVNNTIEFSTDMKQGNASYSDQRRSFFALSKQNVHDESFCRIIVFASTNPNNPNTIVCQLLYDDNGTEVWEESGYLPIPDGDGWHNGKIKIRSDRIVEFYLDESLVYTSTNEITTAYNGQAAVEIGGRKSLYDNVQVIQID